MLCLRSITCFVLLAVCAGTARAQTTGSGKQQADPDGVKISVENSSPTTVGFSYRWDKPVNFRPGTPATFAEPAWITGVVPGTSAAQAGLAVGDIILSSNGKDGRLGRLFPDRRLGAKYVLRIRRGDEEREITFVVSPSPQERPK